MEMEKQCNEKWRVIGAPQTHDQVYKYLKSTGYKWWSFQRKDLHQEALIRNLDLSKRRKLTATSFFKEIYIGLDNSIIGPYDLMGRKKSQ